MKWFASLMLVSAGLLLAGCVHHHPAHPASVADPAPTIVTPDNSLAGKVASYNDTGRFVVLNFPAGRMPKMNQNLFLYRAGMKVAEVVVTGPQSDDNTVADLVSGDAQTGDEVRDK
ncbi:MAG TPA: hypothetical protein VGF90_06210 [Verrucomicrobiae bacterium]